MLPAIRDRLTRLGRQDAQWAPFERGRRYFTLRRKAADDLPILFVRDGLSGRDDVLLDPHPLSADHTTSVTVEDISLDGQLLIYGVRTSGEDETELRTRDVKTRKDLPDRLGRALYRGVSVRPDGSGFFYALQDRATYEAPTEFPVGIDYVLVNGQVVIEQGRHTGARPGKVVYGAGRQP